MQPTILRGSWESIRKRSDGSPSSTRARLQIPVFGAVGAAIANASIIGKIMAGGYADPRKMPADLIAIFVKSGRNPNFHYAERKVLAGWRSWSQARERYSKVKAPVTLIYGDRDWSRIRERTRTRELLKDSRIFTLKNSGHFSSVENPQEVARIVLSGSFKTEAQQLQP